MSRAIAAGEELSTFVRSTDSSMTEVTSIELPPGQYVVQAAGYFTSSSSGPYNVVCHIRGLHTFQQSSAWSVAEQEDNGFRQSSFSILDTHTTGDATTASLYCGVFNSINNDEKIASVWDAVLIATKIDSISGGV